MTDNQKIKYMSNKLILIALLCTFYVKVFSQDSLSVASVQLMDYASIKNDKSSVTDPIPNALKNIFDRLYVEDAGIDAYRENLDELLGRIVTKENNGNEIGLISVKRDSVTINSFTPKENKLISHKLTKNSSAALSLFINASATDDRIYEYLVTDISRAILQYKNIDKQLLKSATTIAENQDLKKYYIITAVTVTEISKREFTKKTKKIDATNFPMSGVAITFGGSFFVADDNFEREYKVGFTVTSLAKIKAEVDKMIR